MVNLRCTKKLLSRLHVAKIEDGNISTNILGDWYASYFNVSRKQYFIFTNEITALSVIIPVKELSTMVPRFSRSLGILLKSIGIDKEKIDIELRELKNINFTRTKNRNLLANMNDLVQGARMWILTDQDGDLSQLDIYLAGWLVGPSPYHVPKEKACDLFHNKKEIKVFQADRLFEK